MKRILSMLLALVMVFSMLPMAVFAAEVDSGYASADADSKKSIAYTPTDDGTLTINVGETAINWSSDVMYFGANFSTVVVGSSSGSEAGSYSVDVTAGTTYRVRFWETSGAALKDLPYTITFTSASGGDSTVTAEGTVMTDTSGNAMSGTDVVLAGGDYPEAATHTFTPTADGIMTVHIISCTTGWWYSCDGLCSQTTGKGEWAQTYEVRKGTTYIINMGGYEDWANCGCTLSYEILFYEKELAAVQEKYKISDTVLEPNGDAGLTETITMEENADCTVVTITPSEVGVYTITCSDGSTVANLGNIATLVSLFVDNATYGTSLEWTCEEVAGEESDTILDENYQEIEITRVNQGQSLMLGIKSEAENVTITVEKTGDYEVKTVELQTYVNKATLSQFSVPEGATIGDYVNVQDTVEHTAVLGDDGYYHLDSADGPILLVDMDYDSIVLTDALSDGRGIMYAYVTEEDEDGNKVILEKWDIASAVQAYEYVCDSEMRYPLTEDLLFFYTTYAEGAGTFSYALGDVATDNEDVWMYCMCTMTLADDGEDEAETSGTVTGESYGGVEWVAPATGTVSFDTTGSDVKLLTENYNTIDSIPCSVEVTADTTYIIYCEDAAATVTWEYTSISDDEGGDDGGDDTTGNTLSLGSNDCELAADDTDGDTWTYTATEDGTLTITMSYLEYTYETEDGDITNAAESDTDLAGACGRLMQLLVNGTNAYTNTQSIQVAEGDTVTVKLINNYYYETYAVIDLSMSESEEGGDDTKPDGSESNPYIIESLPYEDSFSLTSDTCRDGLFYKYTAAEKVTLVIGADCLVTLAGYDYKQDDDGNYVVTVPAGNSITINPWATSAGDYSFSVSVKEVSAEPDGSEENPYILDELYTTIDVTTESNYTYVYYQYTVGEDESGLVSANTPSGKMYTYWYINDESVSTYSAPASYEAGDVILIEFYVYYAGTYEVELYDPAVAKIGETVYTSVEKALTAAQSGETVTLVADTSVSTLLVTPGITLDLNGHTLETDYAVGFNGGSIVDNTKTKTGLLKVANGSAVLSKSNSAMAFWNGEGYKFGTFKTADKAAPVVDENGSLAYSFYTQISGALQSLVTDNGTTDNDVSVVIRLTWNTETGTAYQNYVYNDTQVAGVASGYFNATFELGNCTELKDLTLTAVIISETGVEIAGTTYQITE